MPESDARCREVVLRHLNRYTTPYVAVDVGVGHGWYGIKLKEMWPNLYLYGVEVWEPYITDVQRRVYDAIIIQDIRNVTPSVFEGCGLVLLADVLEHMTKPEAQAVVAGLREVVPWGVVTVPIVNYEQGAVNGNPYEAHLHQWARDEVVSDLGLTYIGSGGPCGIFEWRD